MTSLVIRRLLVDLKTPVGQNWCDGDAFKTAFFNALSLSFPAGEQFFIDSVSEGFKKLTPEAQAKYEVEIKGFKSQEATHRHIHGLFNEHLYKAGLENVWSKRIAYTKGLLEEKNVAIHHWVGITAANEHLTSIFAYWLLKDKRIMGNTEQRIQNMWLWHSCEEDEHKSIAFDLYGALEGNYKWRKKWLVRASYLFTVNLLLQMKDNLKKEGQLWKYSTWKSGIKFFFGKGGIVREIAPLWKQYLKEDFHPSQQVNPLSAKWLENNQDLYKVV
jgi:predicted metal-dependent hydrolase